MTCQPGLTDQAFHKRLTQATATPQRAWSGQSWKPAQRRIDRERAVVLERLSGRLNRDQALFVDRDGDGRHRHDIAEIHIVGAAQPGNWVQVFGVDFAVHGKAIADMEQDDFADEKVRL